MTKLFRHKQEVIPVCYFFFTKLNSNAFFLQMEIKKVKIPGKLRWFTEQPSGVTYTLGRKLFLYGIISLILRIIYFLAHFIVDYWKEKLPTEWPIIDYFVKLIERTPETDRRTGNRQLVDGLDTLYLFYMDDPQTKKKNHFHLIEHHQITHRDKYRNIESLLGWTLTYFKRGRVEDKNGGIKNETGW